MTDRRRSTSSSWWQRRRTREQRWSITALAFLGTAIAALIAMAGTTACVTRRGYTASACDKAFLSMLVIGSSLGLGGMIISIVVWTGCCERRPGEWKEVPTGPSAKRKKQTSSRAQRAARRSAEQHKRQRLAEHKDDSQAEGQEERDSAAMPVYSATGLTELAERTAQALRVQAETEIKQHPFPGCTLDTLNHTVTCVLKTYPLDLGEPLALVEQVDSLSQPLVQGQVGSVFFSGPVPDGQVRLAKAEFDMDLLEDDMLLVQYPEVITELGHLDHLHGRLEAGGEFSLPQHGPVLELQPPAGQDGKAPGRPRVWLAVDNRQQTMLSLPAHKVSDARFSKVTGLELANTLRILAREELVAWGLGAEEFCAQKEASRLDSRRLVPFRLYASTTVRFRTSPRATPDDADYEVRRQRAASFVDTLGTSNVFWFSVALVLKHPQLAAGAYGPILCHLLADLLGPLTLASEYHEVQEWWDSFWVGQHLVRSMVLALQSKQAQAGLPETRLPASLYLGKGGLVEHRGGRAAARAFKQLPGLQPWQKEIAWLLWEVLGTVRLDTAPRSLLFPELLRSGGPDSKPRIGVVMTTSVHREVRQSDILTEHSLYRLRKSERFWIVQQPPLLRESELVDTIEALDDDSLGLLMLAGHGTAQGLLHLWDPTDEERGEQTDEEWETEQAARAGTHHLPRYLRQLSRKMARDPRRLGLKFNAFVLSACQSSVLAQGATVSVGQMVVAAVLQKTPTRVYAPRVNSSMLAMDVKHGAFQVQVFNADDNDRRWRAQVQALRAGGGSVAALAKAKWLAVDQSTSVWAPDAGKLVHLDKVLARPDDPAPAMWKRHVHPATAPEVKAWWLAKFPAVQAGRAPIPLVSGYLSLFSLIKLTRLELNFHRKPKDPHRPMALASTLRTDIKAWSAWSRRLLASDTLTDTDLVAPLDPARYEFTVQPDNAWQKGVRANLRQVLQDELPVRPLARLHYVNYRHLFPPHKKK